MKVAIVGLPLSGKSTVFDAVTGHPHDPAAMPAIRHGTVRVPDARLEYLTKLYNPKKVTEATIEFVDIPGGAATEAGAQDSFRRALPEIRLCDALAVVVRDHAEPSVPKYRDRIDPAADMREIWDELIFGDLDSVTTRIERIDKSLKKPTKTRDHDLRELEVLKRCESALEGGQPLSSVLAGDEDRRLLSSFAFLTQRPMVVVRNVSEDHIAGEAAPLSDHAAEIIALCASAEAEIAQLDPADRAAFLEDLRIEVPARDRLIQACYEVMGMISFLTMGPDEVRAWTIHKGCTAVEAAGKIHSDLARGFIRAETVAYDDMVTYADFRGAKAAGKVRQEGKTYVVADGDILNIKFNV